MLITLTTDFGLSDPFVGVMKGVMLSIAPEARIVDLTHHVPAQDILTGALVMESVVGDFPPGSVHVGVVDPGVGGARRAIAVETQHAFFIGPDNGLFTAALALDPPVRVVELNNTAFHLQPTSATFHGRDIFAPAAAHLASGTPIDRLGSPCPPPMKLPLPEPEPMNDRALLLHVLRVDHFGNLITELTEEQFTRWLAEQGKADAADERRAYLRIGHWRIDGVRRTFADVEPGQAVAYFGSTGRLEIAVRDGSAYALFHAEEGATMTLHRG